MHAGSLADVHDLPVADKDQHDDELDDNDDDNDDYDYDDDIALE